MATTTKVSSNPTLADVMDRTDPNGDLADIVEVLTETNEMIPEITWVEANNKFSHRTTVRTGLPTVTWRKLNYGVQPSKSKTAQVTDTCGMLEAFSRVDKKLAEINGMLESWRASEERPFLEAMSQEFQRAILFGDSARDPAKIMGFSPPLFHARSGEGGQRRQRDRCGRNGLRPYVHLAYRLVPQHGSRPFP